LGWLFFGAMFFDLLLWLLVLLGIESVILPEKLWTIADVRFAFPYCHGLAASLLWSLTAFATVWFFLPMTSPLIEGTRIARVLAAAVFCHFILDWLVHIPELPLLGPTSPPLDSVFQTTCHSPGQSKPPLPSPEPSYLKAQPSFAFRVGVAS
jgi:hypothetical protein